MSAKRPDDDLDPLETLLNNELSVPRSHRPPTLFHVVDGKVIGEPHGARGGFAAPDTDETIDPRSFVPALVALVEDRLHGTIEERAAAELRGETPWQSVLVADLDANELTELERLVVYSHEIADLPAGDEHEIADLPAGDIPTPAELLELLHLALIGLPPVLEDVAHLLTVDQDRIAAVLEELGVTPDDAPEVAPGILGELVRRELARMRSVQTA